MTFLDLIIDLPHASLLWDPQNHVSVIIRCKVAKTEVVENVRRLLALREMRSVPTVSVRGGIDRPLRDHVPVCTFERHFVILTRNMPPGSK